MKIYSIYSKRKRKKFIFNDNVQKNSILNNFNLLAEHNLNYVKSLNSIYRNYLINSYKNDNITDDNLRKISYQKLKHLKINIKHSEKLLKEFDEKYIFNIIEDIPRKNISETLVLNDFNNSEENKSLNISYINKKEKEKKINNQKENISVKNAICLKNENHLKFNNIKTYTSKDFHSGVKKTRNNFKKYLNMAKYLKNNSKRLKSADNSSNLYEKINNINKKEDNKQNNNSLYKEKILQQKSKSKNNLLFIPKTKTITYKSFIRSSSAINRTYKTIINKNKKNINFISSKTENNNKSDLNNNFTNTSNRITSATNNIRKINHLTSSSLNSIDIKKKRLHSSLLISSMNKIRYNSTKKARETSKSINYIAFKTINEGNIINYELRRNYSTHKEPSIILKRKNILSESLNNDKIEHTDKMDLNKLRSELNLKNSNGLFGKINEIDIMKNDLKKMGKRLSKDYMKILKPITRGIIRQDILANKQLIYNVGIENRKIRKKYFKNFGKLTNLKKQKKLIENYVIN